MLCPACSQTSSAGQSVRVLLGHHYVQPCGAPFGLGSPRWQRSLLYSIKGCAVWGGCCSVAGSAHSPALRCSSWLMCIMDGRRWLRQWIPATHMGDTWLWADPAGLWRVDKRTVSPLLPPLVSSSLLPPPLHLPSLSQSPFLSRFAIQNMFINLKYKPGRCALVQWIAPSFIRTPV